MNVIEVPVDGERITLGDLTIRTTPAQRAAQQSKRITIGVRPENLRVVAAGRGLRATVEAVEEPGSDSYLYLTADTPEGPATTVARTGVRDVPAGARRSACRSDPDNVHLFDTFSGDRLRG